MESRSVLPSGINELNWVKEKVSRGLDWKGVKSLLRPSEENLQSLEREEKLLLPSVLITYDNVRGAMYRKRTTNSQKASNIVTSVKRWIKQIQDNGGKGLFQTNMSGDPKSFLVAWCTGFQLRLKDHDKMRPLLKAMRTASSEEQLNSLWSHFKAQFPRAKKFIAFIEKSWMTSEKKSKWTVFVRENYQHIDTNNLVESWHKTLKRHHLGKERNLRADFVVYLLQGAVDRDFRMTYLKINRGVQPLRLSQYDKKRKGRAMELSLDIARIMITVNLDEGKATVLSFTIPGIRYSVAIDTARSLLLSCTCLDHDRHKIPCKHMYLVQRVYSNLKVKHCTDLVPFQQTAVNNDYFGPPLQSVLSRNLSLQLEAARAESEAAKKRERDDADAEVIRESYDELRTMWFSSLSTRQDEEESDIEFCFSTERSGETATDTLGCRRTIRYRMPDDDLLTNSTTKATSEDTAIESSLKDVVTDGQFVNLIVFDTRQLRPRRNSNTGNGTEDSHDKEMLDVLQSINHDMEVEDPFLSIQKADDGPTTTMEPIESSASTQQRGRINWMQRSRDLENVGTVLANPEDCLEYKNATSIGIDPGVRGVQEASRISKLESQIPSLSISTVQEYFIYLCTSSVPASMTALDRITSFYRDRWYRWA
ncbi:hypothetical protein B0O80DRAFT_496160 [Mortierella sp. GBAus27b]|nr:hypothetical protein B0O80DRAFT_496160 [Mortierella sp. GBAus27b]